MKNKRQYYNEIQPINFNTQHVKFDERNVLDEEIAQIQHTRQAVSFQLELAHSLHERINKKTTRKRVINDAESVLPEEKFDENKE